MEHERSTSAGDIFVARPFNITGDRLFERLIYPALRASCFNAVHCPLGNDEHAVEIIRSTVSQCEAVLALIAGQRHNVYVEIGMAIALRKPLVLVADSDADAGMLADVYPIVFLNEHDRLVHELQKLKPVLGDGGASAVCVSRQDLLDTLS